MYCSESHNPILPESERPEWLHYPEELLDLVRSRRMPLIPWHFERGDTVASQYRRFRSRLGRDLVPFAFRQDREDVACFEKGKGHEVFIIHDNCDAGYEDVGHFASFSDWLRDVEAEAAEWAEDARRDASREVPLETNSSAYAKGIEAAKADIATGHLQYRWHGHCGHWGHWIVNELQKRFGVGVNDGFGICFVTESQISFDDGYNATLTDEINRRHGEGAFEAVLAESRKQSEEALGDARRAWLDRHGQE